MKRIVIRLNIVPRWSEFVLLQLDPLYTYRPTPIISSQTSLSTEFCYAIVSAAFPRYRQTIIAQRTVWQDADGALLGSLCADCTFLLQTKRSLPVVSEKESAVMDL